MLLLTLLAAVWQSAATQDKGAGKPWSEMAKRMGNNGLDPLPRTEARKSSFVSVTKKISDLLLGPRSPYTHDSRRGLWRTRRRRPGLLSGTRTNTLVFFLWLKKNSHWSSRKKKSRLMCYSTPRMARYISASSLARGTTRVRRTPAELVSHGSTWASQPWAGKTAAAD